MTKQEFATWAMALKTYYAKEQLLPNPQAMELWFRELQDIPVEVADAALRKWVSTNKWSPTIAEIREVAANVRNGELPDWSEGWEQVQSAIRKFGYMEPRKAMESFDPITRECVKRLGFVKLCQSENSTADRANFRQCYEILVQREQTRQQVALPLQQTIKQLQMIYSDERLKLEGGNGDGC